MKLCYAYSSLDSLVVPCDVIVHFWWPNIQYRAGSLLTAEDMAFSPPLMIKVTNEMKAYWEFNQKERPLCLHVFYHWWWTVCIAAKMSSKTWWNCPWLLDPTVGYWLSLVLISREGSGLQIMTRDTWVLHVCVKHTQNPVDRLQLLGSDRPRHREICV